jgi:hypothetical protein
MKPAERMNFNDGSAAELKRLQDNILRAVNPITGIPILDGRIIGPIAVTTSFQPVNHGLGRQFMGWWPVRIDANAVLFEDFSWAQQTTSISLRASAGCNVYLWVF